MKNRCAGCFEPLAGPFTIDYVNETEWHPRCYSTALRVLVVADGGQAVGLPALPE